jgi:hypothetical protein
MEKGPGGVFEGTEKVNPIFFGGIAFARLRCRE